jgi:metal-sulfur cluster biosynthetic enzyme
MRFARMCSALRRIARLIREAVRRLPPLEPWEEELRFMDRWSSSSPVGPGREWRREDLHERT